MGIFNRLKAWLYNADVVNVNDFETALSQCLHEADVDSNGMLSVKEVMDFCKNTIVAIRQSK